MPIKTEGVYFEKKGRANTNEVLALAKQRAISAGITDIVVASSTGSTGKNASEVFAGYNLVVVTTAVGAHEPNKRAMLDENRSIIEANGGRILTTGHAFGMIGRAINNKFGVMQSDELVAHVLRLFGQGVKVGCEIACMAADAGLIETGKEAIAIAGSGGGADAAILLLPSNSHTFFNTRVLEIICKPRE